MNNIKTSPSRVLKVSRTRKGEREKEVATMSDNKSNEVASSDASALEAATSSESKIAKGFGYKRGTHEAHVGVLDRLLMTRQ